MGALAKLDTIVGVKDATGDLSRVAKQRITCGHDFIQLSGEDPHRRRVQRDGRTGLHLGHRQRRADALRRDAGGDAGGRLRRARSSFPTG